ncbi:HAD-IIIA family hydrolase [Xanthobacter sp. DSM 24535]|uniref:HAD-IIIA family hydrolase n=1 Tax=Roseixanthobacter psychrophilus TaxID=3119917 RepID=UPI00372A6F7D
MRIRQAAILCGGLGTRLGSLTAQCPKPLLPVDGRPFLEILSEELVRQGVDRILLLAAFESEQVRDFAATLPGRLEADIQVEVCIEPDRAGTGGALWHAREHLDETFFLLNGDSWFDVPLERLAAALPADAAVAGVLGLRALEDTGRFGVVRLEGEVITEFAARPEHPGAGLVNAGVYLFRRSILSALTPKGSLEQDALPGLARAGHLRGVPASGYFIDIGIPDDYARAQYEIPARRRRPAVFFDRDGVLNLDHGYIGQVERFEWVPGAREAIRRVNQAGYYAFIVTNQAGIAKGHYDEAAYRVVRAHMRDELAQIGAHIDDERFAPDHPDGIVAAYRRVSDWRKPGPGMLLDLLRRWPVDAAHSFLIGDQPTDIQAAEAAGIPGHLFPGGNLDTFIAPLLAAHPTAQIEGES